MLFNIPRAAAPTSFQAIAKAKFIRLKVATLSDNFLPGYDPRFREFIAFRYANATDATNDANRVDEIRFPNTSFDYGEELVTQSTVYFRIAYYDEDENLSFLSSTVSVVYRGATTADLEDDAVTDRKRKRRDSSNMVRNPDMDDVGLWSGSAGLVSIASSIAAESTNRLEIAASAATTNISTLTDLPVKGGKKYYVEATLFSPDSIAISAQMQVNWYSDLAGSTFISNVGLGNVNLTTTYEYKGILTAPAGARRARLIAYKNSGANSKFSAAGFTFRRATDEDLLADEAVSEPKVKDDAITDRKRKTGDSSNAMRNPECDDASLWAASIGNVSSLPSGSAVASKNFIATTAMTSQVDIYAGRGGVADLNVKAGKKYFASGYIGTSSGLATSCELYIQWFSMDATGVMTFISSSLVGTYAGTGISRVEKVVTAPGTARRARYLVRKLATAAAVTNVILEPEFRLATDKEILADRAVRARHRQQEDNENLIPDGEFEQMTLGATAAVADDIMAIWDCVNGVPPTNFWTWDGDTDSGGKALILDNLVAGGASGGTIPSLHITTVDFIPVKAANYLAWEVSRRTTDAFSNIGFYVRFVWFDKNKASLGATPQTDAISNGSIPAAWTTSDGFVAVPAGAKYFKLRIFHNSNATTRYLIIDRVFVRKAKGAELTVDGSLVDAKLDPTPPGIPTAVAFSQLTRDTDAGDGRVRINGRITWNAPAGGVPVKRYIIEVNDGENTETLYAPANRRAVKVKDMVVGRTYNAQVSAESVAGYEGTQSGAVPCTPTAKATAPGVVTAVSIVQKATFNRIKWTAPADKDYAGANVYHNTVNNPATATLLDRAGSTKYDDTTARAPGALNYYFVEAVNRSGIPAATRVAAANNPVASRGVGFADTNMTDPNAYAENSDLSLGPNIGWSDPTNIVNDAANAYKGNYVLRRTYAGAASSYVNRNNLYFAVREGEQYVFGGMVKTSGSWAGAATGWRLSLLDAAGVEIATTPLAGPTAVNGIWNEYQAKYTVAAGVAFARLEWASYSQTAGAAFGSHGYLRPVVTEVMTDQTAPAQPAAPVMTVLTADFDKDGELDQGFFMNLPTWAAGTIVVKYWEIEHQVATAQGSSGSMTGYSKRRANAIVKAEPSPTATYYEFEANAQRWHKTRVRGVSFSGKEGPWSVYQNLGAQPQEYNAMTGVTPATPTVLAVDNGIEITWVPTVSPTLARTQVRQGATVVYDGPGNKFLDKTVRTVGASYTYTVIHYDRAGHATNSSAASAAAVYRQAVTAEIQDQAITTIKTNLGDTANLVKDNQLAETALWTSVAVGGATGVSFARHDNANGDLGASPYFFRLTGNLSGPGMRMSVDSLVINPCVGGKRYTFSCTMKAITTPAAGFVVGVLEVDWYELDASGDPVFLSASVDRDSVDITPGQPAKPFEFSEIAPPTAAFFVIKARTQPLLTSYGIHTIEVGGFYARESSTGVFETVEVAGTQNVAAGATVNVISLVSNHTKAAQFVIIAGAFKNTAGGARTITVYFRKETTDLKSVVINLGTEEFFYAEFFDDDPGGVDSSEYHIRIFAGGGQVFPVAARYMMTQAFFG